MVIDTIILLFTSAIQAAFILAVFLAMFAVLVSILASETKVLSRYPPVA